MASSVTDVTINSLNSQCLEHIFLYLPIVERVRLRKVCKQWREVSDGCWRKVQYLRLCHHFRPDFATGLVRRCGPYLRTLIDEHTHGYSILPDVSQHCRNLRDLKLRVASSSDDSQLTYLLCVNDQVTRLHLKISNEEHCKSFATIPTRLLEELGVEFELTGAPKLDTLVAIRQIIRRADTLKNFSCNVVDDETMELISEKVSLEDFKLDAVEWPRVSYDGLQNIYSMKNLKTLYIAISRIIPNSDELIAEICTNCPMLERTTLIGFSTATDDSIVALSQLIHLRQLSLGLCSITDAELRRLVNLELLGLTCCKKVCDAGVIEFLRGSSAIRYLSFYGTGITKETIIAANVEAKRRNKCNPLYVRVFPGDIEIIQLHDKSPLLDLKWMPETHEYSRGVMHRVNKFVNYITSIWNIFF